MTKLRSRLAQATVLITHYDTLGVSPGDELDTIHDAYLELAWSLHPDHGGDPEKIKVVNLAWGTLKSKESKARYDAQLKLNKALNCVPCAGKGRRAGFVAGKYSKDGKCNACGGKGHV